MNPLFKINDYELLYLIRENNSVATNIMYQKYRPFIYTKIRKYNLNYDIDEYTQEGYIALYKAIKTFSENSRTRFFTYFDVILKNHLINCLRRNKKIIEVNSDFVYSYEDQNTNILSEVIYDYNTFEILEVLSSKMEREVFIYYFVKDYSIDLIEKTLGITAKQIYNTIRRIREKMKI